MLKQRYSRFLSANPHRLHFAAHSHHLWPDCTREAQLKYWDDSAQLVDDKWEHIFSEVIPVAQRHIAQILALPDSRQIAFAPNTHEFVMRILSAMPANKRIRVLTTDSEFHSFTRQLLRLEQEDLVEVSRVAVEPFATFEERFTRALTRENFDLVFFSQVFFTSGFAPAGYQKLAELAAINAPVVVLDGYHGFCAVPTDLSAIASKVFYLGGGYKYAQSGEGACFCAIPAGTTLEPRFTGWYSSFESLEQLSKAEKIKYGPNYLRFFGSTFDPSGIYRLNAALGMLRDESLSVQEIHLHVRSLQQHFLSLLQRRPLSWLNTGQALAINNSIEAPLVPDPHAHFLTFRVDNAAARVRELRQKQIIIDSRGEYLRLGFGLYHEFSDVDALMQRLHQP